LPDRPLQEGDYYTLKAAIYDPPPGLQLLYSWTVRRGDQVLIWQELSTEIAYPTYLEGEHTVELTVTALFYGPVAKATGTFTVENVAPRNLVVSGPTTGVPGMHMLFAGGHEDPGDASEHETVESWKLYRNGVLQEELTQPYFSNMPSQPGDYRLRYLVTDDQGVQTAVDHSFVVTTSLKRENELFIGGTTGADVIRVEPANSPAGAVRVLLGSENVGVYSNVTKLTAFAMEGNDLVTIDSRVRVASEIYGGGGNDQLIGGSGPDLLIGGPGNDKLHGRNGHDLLQGQAGQDLLYGGAGRDLLFGGTEVDRLFGGTGEDLLFGRATRFDTNFNALFSIQSRWIANLDFNARVATLNGSQSGRHMLTTFATVLHDKAQDYLAGNEDRDW
jgi:Ca2+-binding RTX toxin-like protein